VSRAWLVVLIRRWRARAGPVVVARRAGALIPQVAAGDLPVGLGEGELRRRGAGLPPVGPPDPLELLRQPDRHHPRASRRGLPVQVGIGRFTYWVVNATTCPLDCKIGTWVLGPGTRYPAPHARPGPHPPSPRVRHDTLRNYAHAREDGPRRAGPHPRTRSRAECRCFSQHLASGRAARGRLSCRRPSSRWPGPLLLVGGEGEKRTLPAAIAYADVINWQVGIDEFTRKSRVVAQLSEAGGRDPASLRRTHAPNFQLFESDREFRRWRQDEQQAMSAVQRLLRHRHLRRGRVPRRAAEPGHQDDRRRCYGQRDAEQEHYRAPDLAPRAERPRTLAGMRPRTRPRPDAIQSRILRNMIAILCGSSSFRGISSSRVSRPKIANIFARRGSDPSSESPILSSALRWRAGRPTDVLRSDSHFIRPTLKLIREPGLVIFIVRGTFLKRLVLVRCRCRRRQADLCWQCRGQGRAGRAGRGGSRRWPADLSSDPCRRASRLAGSARFRDIAQTARWYWPRA
jgi:hypothetical protein